MASNSKNLAELLNGDITVTATDIADGSVTAVKLASDSVTTAKIADGNITAAKLAAGAAVPDQTGNSGKVLTSDGTDASWTTVENTLTSPTGYRNMIYNGAMNVHQRGDQTGKTSSFYGLDRWQMNWGSGTWSMEKVSTNLPSNGQFRNSLKLSCTSSGSSNLQYLRQRFEGVDTFHLGYGTSDAQATTLSYWVKSNVTGSHSAGLVQHSGTQRGFYWTYNISTADTWTYVTVNIPGDTGGGSAATNTMFMSLDLFVSGTSGTLSGTLDSWGARFTDHGAVNIDTAGNYIQFTGVQWEVGSVATAYEHKPYTVEEALCSRYFQELGTLNMQGWNHNIADTGGSRSQQILWPVKMRTTPSMYWEDNAGNVSRIYVEKPNSTSSNNITYSFFPSANGLAGYKYPYGNLYGSNGDSYMISAYNVTLDAEL